MKSKDELKGFSDRIGFFFAFFFFSVEIQKSTQVDGKVSRKYLV